MFGLEGLFCFRSRVHQEWVQFYLHISAENINIAESLYETVESKNLQLCFSFLFQAEWSKKPNISSDWLLEGPDTDFIYRFPCNAE